MKVVQLTAGVGNFYCGNCARDTALMVALKRLGHDPMFVPLYLPIVSEHSAQINQPPLFFGGLNIFLQNQLPLFRKTPRWLDAILDAPPLLRWLATKSQMVSACHLGKLTLAMLQGDEGRLKKEMGRLLEWLGGRERPDIINLSNLLLVGLAPAIKQKLGVPVVCTLQGEDGYLDALREPYRKRAWSIVSRLADGLDGLIAVSQYYADQMAARLSLDSDRIEVIRNGIDLEGYGAAPPLSQGIPVLGYLARMTPVKGLSTLVEAFIILRERGERVELSIAGSMTPGDGAYVRGLQQRLDQAGVSESVQWHANLTREEKLEFLRSLTVLSVPTTYGEAFGLYVLEALAAGVAVAQPRHGAFPEILAQTGGGILCEPNDPQALADALTPLLRDPARARKLGQEGRRAVHQRFGIDRMAEELVDYYGKVIDKNGSLDPVSRSLANEREPYAERFHNEKTG